MSAQNELPISRFPVPELDALPEDIRSRILKVQEKSTPKASRSRLD